MHTKNKNEEKWDKRKENGDKLFSQWCQLYELGDCDAIQCVL